MWNEQNYLLKMCTDLNFLRNWRKFLVKAVVAELESKWVRKNAMEMAIDSKENVLENIPSKKSNYTTVEKSRQFPGDVQQA